MINLGFLFMLYKNFSNPIPREKANTEKIKSKPESFLTELVFFRSS